MTSIDLLNEFREHGSDTAFGGLVRQYANLVYSIARRRVGEIGGAEDVAQAVFIRLAKSPPQVESDADLTGWLHRTTLHVAIDHWRSESRRQAREKIASTMHTESSDLTHDAAWSRIAPQIDQAIDSLPGDDRRAILLRFFERRSMRDLGTALDVSENAAKMRVCRAIEKLRQSLAAQGIASSAALLGSMLDQPTLEVAPSAAVTEWISAPSFSTSGRQAPNIASQPSILKTIIAAVKTGKIALGIGALVVTFVALSLTEIDPLLLTKMDPPGGMILFPGGR